MAPSKQIGQPESGATERVRRTPESRWEFVYRETRRRILTLELSPGTPLSEVAVAREFGTSATPARDALGRLRQEGLVVDGPRRSYSVAALSISDVGQLAELRYVLESGAVALAIRRVTRDGLEHVRMVAREVEDPNLDATDRIEKNEAFHLAVAELAANEHLVGAIRGVLEDSRRVFHLGIASLPAEEMTDLHRRLVDAIEDGDEEAARVVCEEEAFGTSERVLSQLVRGGQERGRYVLATREQSIHSENNRGAAGTRRLDAEVSPPFGSVGAVSMPTPRRRGDGRI